MSHELRTPLNAVIGFTGTLLMKLPGPLNAEQEKQLRTVQSGARHLLLLINDLLDLAKLGSDKPEFNFEEVDWQGAVQNVAESLRPLAEKKGLVFDVVFPDHPVTSRTDRRALTQIVINLLGNAIKFTDQGHVRLRLRRVVTTGVEMLELSVEDSGIGIPEFDQERLFEAFSRGAMADKRKREGTGLGLHLSQKLAAALGGGIGFKSECDRGSTFTLELPAR